MFLIFVIFGFVMKKMPPPEKLLKFIWKIVTTLTKISGHHALRISSTFMFALTFYPRTDPSLASLTGRHHSDTHNNSFYIWLLSAAPVHQFLLASPPSDKVGGRLETGASGGLAGVSGNGSGNTIRPSLLLLLGLFSRYTKHCTPLHGTAK